MTTKPDYESTKNQLAQLVNKYLEEVDRDIMMESLFHWLEYTYSLEKENQWLYGKLNIISMEIERGREESKQFK